MRTLAPVLAFGLGLACAAAPALAQQSDPDRKPSKTDPLDALDVPDLELYRAGSLLLHKGDHVGAIQRFSELLEKHPKSRWAPEARFWRASALEETGQREAALAAYQSLLKQAPKSGWAKDASRRIARLTRKVARTALLKCTVQLKEGKPFTARLHELTGEGALLSGGPFKTPQRVGFARLVRLEVEGGVPRTVVLSNGDQFSGKFVIAGPDEIVIEVPGIKTPLRVPPARLRSLRAPGKASTAWVGTRRGSDIYGLPRGPRMGAFALAGDDVERETTVNPDGSRTTTTIDGSGRKTVTTVSREGKGRKVMILRGEGDEGARIELKLDGGAAGEALLGELADELPHGLAEQLGDVDLDLDFEIDDTELSDLDEALRDLPRELRERIQRSLHEQRRKRAKRNKGRRVWVQRGRDGEERVLILEDEDAPKARRLKKRVVVVEGKDGKRQKHVVILGEGDLHAGPHKKRIKKRVMILGEGDDDAGPHKKRIKKRVMILGEGDHEGVVILEDEEGPHRPQVKKRVRVRGGAKGPQERRIEKRILVLEDGDPTESEHLFDPMPFDPSQNDFTFGPNSGGMVHDFTAPSENVYRWVSEEPERDRVFLRNGDTLSGKVRSLDASELKLDTDYGKVTIRRDQVRQVVFAKPAVPFLGITMKATSKGVEVADVHAGSAAAAAGLKKGDLIVGVGAPVSGSPALTVEALGARVKELGVGGTIKLVVQRGKAILLLEARLLKRPRRVSRAPLTTDLLHSGRGGPPKRYRALTDQYRRVLKSKKKDSAKDARAAAEAQRALAEALRSKAEGERRKADGARRKAIEQLEKLEEDQTHKQRLPSGKPRLGVALSEAGGKITISQVMAGSLAARVGLKAGDRIVRLQGKAVSSISDVAAALKGARQVSIRVERGAEGKIQVLELRFDFGN